MMDSTGCRNLSVIQEALADNAGDVDATVEYLVQMRAIGQDQDWESATSAPSISAAYPVREQHTASPTPKSPSRSRASAPAVAIVASASHSGSGNDLDTLERLQAILDSTGANRPCPLCSSSRTFRVCCMKKVHSSVQQLRASARVLDEFKLADAAAASVAAAHAPHLSNKERKEQQRLEKESTADSSSGSGGGGGARRKAKSKRDVANGGNNSCGGNVAAMRVVGI